ncbi:pimeloyl-ACP methyl ester carboxylesterase [Oxalobacteraceae bacterium GrIS 1.11]
MIPAAIIIITAAVTLKSDGEPVKIVVNKPRGTVYWGGAGLDGPYLMDQVRALQEVGVKDVWVGKRTLTTLPDAMRSGSDLRYKGRSDDRTWMLDGMEKMHSDQFNLIGYSYGSLMAAQTAHVYATNGDIIDHLVLVGSPIDGDFLADLRANKNIKKIIVLNLTQYDDPIFAGIPQWRLTISAIKLGRQMKASQEKNDGIGHFYYAPATDEGKRRRRVLARLLYSEGLR